MKSLGPEARRVLELASAARTPSSQDKARVARRVAVAVGAATTATVQVGVAHAATSAAAGKWGMLGAAAKAWIGAGAVLATTLTGYALWPNSSAPATLHARSAVLRPTAAPALTQSRAQTVATPLPATTAPTASRAQTAATPLPAATAATDSRAQTAATPLPAASDAPREPYAKSTRAQPLAAPVTSALSGAHMQAPAIARTPAPAGFRSATSTARRTHEAAQPMRPVLSAAGDHATLEAAQQPAPQAATATTTAASDTLGAELDLLHRAQVAWRAREAAGALALLNEHRARYPHSTLQLERDALQVLTLCELGKTADAARLAHSVLSAAPHSPLRASLEESCALK